MDFFFSSLVVKYHSSKPDGELGNFWIFKVFMVQQNTRLCEYAHLSLWCKNCLKELSLMNRKKNSSDSQQRSKWVPNLNALTFLMHYTLYLQNELVFRVLKCSFRDISITLLVRYITYLWKKKITWRLSWIYSYPLFWVSNIIFMTYVHWPVLNWNLVNWKKLVRFHLCWKESNNVQSTPNILISVLSCKQSLY